MNAKKIALLGVALLSWSAWSCWAVYEQSGPGSQFDFYSPPQYPAPGTEIVPPLYNSCPSYHVQGQDVQLPEGFQSVQIPLPYGSNSVLVAPGINNQSLYQAPTSLSEYFQRLKTIETENCLMLPFDQGHADALQEQPDEHAQALAKVLSQSREEGEAAPWSIFCKKRNRFVGYCGIGKITDNQGVVVCEFLPKFCGKGSYFEEVMRMVLQEAFETLGLNQITFDKKVSVPGLERVEGLGFTSVRVFTQSCGKYECIKRFTITRDGYFGLDEAGQKKLIESELAGKNGNQEPDAYTCYDAQPNLGSEPSKGKCNLL